MKHASLFTGIGGFDYAAEQIGFDNIFQVEKDEKCLVTLKKRFPKTIQYGDIKEFDGTKYRGTIDILSGGFPCQNISISNQTGTGIGIKGQKSILWFEYARIIREINPRFIVIENSPQLLRKGFEEVLFELSEIGFNAQWDCLPAIPFTGHQRYRVYVVAYPKSYGRIQTSFFKGVWEEVYNGRERDFNDLFIEDIGYTYPGFPKNICLDDGVSYTLDEVVEALHGYGNAICPLIALKIFESIKSIS